MSALTITSKVVMTKSLVDQFLGLPTILQLLDTDDIQILQLFSQTGKNVAETLIVAQKIENQLVKQRLTTAA